MLALLVSTWVLSATPHALQSWEKASLVSGTRIWDEPYQQVQFGRAPTANSDSESACKRVAANVGRRDMTRSCVAVQVDWCTCLDSCHHCNICSRCLFAPCHSSHRTWPARIPLPAVWEQTRHRHRMAPQRMPLRMFFNSRTVASSCFRRQPGGSQMKCSNGLQRSKLHTSPTPTSTWKNLSKTIRYHETPCKGRPQLGSRPLRDAKVEGGRIDRRLSAWSKQQKRPPREYLTDSCLKGLRRRTQWAMRREVTWHRWTKICGWVPFLAPLRSQEACFIEPHRESRQTPRRSCPPNRTCQSRQSAHPYSSVGFASKSMRHPWEGTVHQHTAIWTDHRRRTARPARDSTAITSLGVPCRRGKILVRTARACNHYQSCDPQHAKLLKPCPRSPSSVWALMLGPMTTARMSEKQQGPESHGRDTDRMGAADGPKASSKNAARPSRRAPVSGRHPKGAASRPLEKRSQARTAPKLGKIGTASIRIYERQDQERAADLAPDRARREGDRDRTPGGCCLPMPPLELGFVGSTFAGASRVVGSLPAIPVRCKAHVRFYPATWRHRQCLT